MNDDKQTNAADYITTFANVMTVNLYFNDDHVQSSKFVNVV